MKIEKIEKMKKIYLKPSAEVISLETCGMLAYSNDNYVNDVSNEENITFDGNQFGDEEEDF